MKRLILSLSSLDDILSLQGCQSVGYCKVILKSRDVVVGGSIASHINELDERFIRISRTILVNKNHIVNFDNKSKSITLTTGDVLPISRRKKKEVVNMLN